MAEAEGQTQPTEAPAAQVEADLKLLVGSLNDSGALFQNPYFIMRPRTALHLATLRDSNGVRTFPNVTVAGGDVLGIPVIVSANVPIDVGTGDATVIVLVDAAEILLAEGGIEAEKISERALCLM